MSDVSSVPARGAGADTTGAPDDVPAGALAAEHQVSYVPGDHRFEVMLDGKPTTLSPMEAVCFVLQNRYLALSDSTAEKTEKMQEQVNEINEANNWLGALKAARGRPGGTFFKPAPPSPALSKWMKDNDIDLADPGADADHTDAALDSLEAKFSSRVDQLSSTNELRMLELKTAVNKSQEALTAADGLLQDLKQLMQTIVGNMAR